MAEDDRLTGLVGYSGMKIPVQAATTASITLSGEQTIDGVACVSGDRVLVKNQASSVDNGIYAVDTGTWERTTDADGPYDFRQGSLVYVYGGAVNGGAVFRCTATNPITVGTTAMTFTAMALTAVPIPVVSGGTGAATAVGGLANLGVIQVTAEAGTNTITGTVDALVTAYRADQLFLLVPAVTNTGATTFNPTPSGGAALGAKNVFLNGAACIGGELIAGSPVALHYDGTQFNIIGNSTFIPAGYLGALGDAIMASAASTPRAMSAAPSPINMSLAFSVGSNALTVAIKTRAGADPTPASPVLIPYRSATAATGDYSWLAVTAAASVVVSSTSTLGTRNAIPFNVWVVSFNDAGTQRLGVINCATTAASAGSGSDVTAIYPLAGFGIASSTAEGGAGAADSAGVFYTGTAVAAKAYTVLGYGGWETGLAAAGTWSAAPTRAQRYVLGGALPGMQIGGCRLDTGVVATGATAVPVDNTIPQSGEGDLFMSAPAYTPASAANILRVRSEATFAHGTGGINEAMSIFQDAVANALKTSAITSPSANYLFRLTVEHLMLAATTAATTFKIRAGGNTGATTTFNGSSAAQLYGGAFNSFIEVREIQG